MSDNSNANGGALDRMVASHAITQLRMRYARATDLVGTGSAEERATGKAIYHEIYTPNATISAEGIDPVTGPDEWADVVEDALSTYQATQHLIGTPVITDLVLPDESGKGGSAHMTSYLQAWHSTAENSLYMFYGTYHDTCTYSADRGWQIAQMHLQKVADEVRDITPREGGLAGD